MEENQIINQNAEGQEQENPAMAGGTATATTNVPVQEPVAETVAAHDDFDWTIDKRNVASYTKEEKTKYDKVYENTFVQLSDGEMIETGMVGLDGVMGAIQALDGKCRRIKSCAKPLGRLPS